MRTFASVNEGINNPIKNISYESSYIRSCKFYY